MLSVAYWLLAAFISPSAAWVIQSKPYSVADLIPRFANESISASAPMPATSSVSRSSKSFTEVLNTVISKKETVLPSEVQVIESKPTSQARGSSNDGNAMSSNSTQSPVLPSVTTLFSSIRTSSVHNMTTTYVESNATGIPSSTPFVTTIPTTGSLSSSSSASNSSFQIMILAPTSTPSNLPQINSSGTIALVPAIPADPNFPRPDNSSLFASLSLTFIPVPLGSLLASPTTTIGGPVISTVFGNSISTPLPTTTIPIVSSASPLRNSPTSPPTRYNQGAQSDSFPLIDPTLSTQNTQPSSMQTTTAIAILPPVVTVTISNTNNGADDNYDSTVYITSTNTVFMNPPQSMMTKVQTTPKTTPVMLTFATATTFDTANIVATITVSVPASEPDPALLSIIPVTEGSESSGSDGKVTVYMTRTVAFSTVTETVYSTVTSR